MGVIDKNTQGLQELLNIQGLHGGVIIEVFSHGAQAGVLIGVTTRVTGVIHEILQVL